MRVFDEETEALMISNDPRVDAFQVEPIPTFPNLASRLGHALDQSSHVKELVLLLDSFENETHESSLFETLTWISTSTTLESISFSVLQDKSPRSLTLLQWCLEALCKRGRMSLLPMKSVSIRFGAICSNTLVRLLHACHPTKLAISCKISQGSSATPECIRSAFSANRSIQELSLAFYPQSTAICCAVLIGLSRNVKLDRVDLHATEVDGQTVAPQMVLDTLVPRLQNQTFSLKTVRFHGFSWTEATTSILDQFLPYVESLGFLGCNFGEYASSQLLSAFDFQQSNKPGLPSGLFLSDDVTLPNSSDAGPVLEQLAGASTGLSHLQFLNEFPLQYAENVLAGLKSKSSCIRMLEIGHLAEAQCSLLTEAMPFFWKLNTLTFWFNWEGDFEPLRKSFLDAAKQNGSIQQYNAHLCLKAQDRIRLEHYVNRNTRLPGLLTDTTATNLDAHPIHSGLALLPRLFLSASDITIDGPAHLFRSLTRCRTRVGLYQDNEAPLLSLTTGTNNATNVTAYNNMSVPSLAANNQEHQKTNERGTKGETRPRIEPTPPQESQRKRQRLQ